MMEKYNKKKSLKFSGFGLEVRTKEMGSFRNLQRNKQWNKLRPITNNVDSNPATPVQEKFAGQSKIPSKVSDKGNSRVEMLNKWREEKQMRLQQERLKRPPFKLSVPHNPPANFNVSKLDSSHLKKSQTLSFSRPSGNKVQNVNTKESATHPASNKVPAYKPQIFRPTSNLKPPVSKVTDVKASQPVLSKTSANNCKLQDGKYKQVQAPAAKPLVNKSQDTKASGIGKLQKTSENQGARSKVILSGLPKPNFSTKNQKVLQIPRPVNVPKVTNTKAPSQLSFGKNKSAASAKPTSQAKLETPSSRQATKTTQVEQNETKRGALGLTPASLKHVTVRRSFAPEAFSFNPQLNCSLFQEDCPTAIFAGIKAGMQRTSTPKQSALKAFQEENEILGESEINDSVAQDESAAKANPIEQSEKKEDGSLLNESEALKELPAANQSEAVIEAQIVKVKPSVCEVSEAKTESSVLQHMSEAVTDDSVLILCDFSKRKIGDSVKSHCKEQQTEDSVTDAHDLSQRKMEDSVHGHCEEQQTEDSVPDEHDLSQRKMEDSVHSHYEEQQTGDSVHGQYGERQMEDSEQNQRDTSGDKMGYVPSQCDTSEGTVADMVENQCEEQNAEESLETHGLPDVPNCSEESISNQRLSDIQEISYDNALNTEDLHLPSSSSCDDSVFSKEDETAGKGSIPKNVEMKSPKFRRSMRLKTNILCVDSPDLNENSILYGTPTKGAVKKNTTSKKTEDLMNTPRRSMRLQAKYSCGTPNLMHERLTLYGTPPEEEVKTKSSACSRITYDFENLHLESEEPVKRGPMTRSKVSLLYTPRQSVYNFKGDLMNFSP